MPCSSLTLLAAVRHIMTRAAACECYCRREVVWMIVIGVAVTDEAIVAACVVVAWMQDVLIGSIGQHNFACSKSTSGD